MVIEEKDSAGVRERKREKVSRGGERGWKGGKEER